MQLLLIVANDQKGKRLIENANLTLRSFVNLLLLFNKFSASDAIPA